MTHEIPTDPLRTLLILAICTLVTLAFGPASALAGAVPLSAPPPADGSANAAAAASGAPHRAAGPTTAGTRKPMADDEPDPDGFRVFWQDGLRALTADGRFELRLGGRLQTDLSFFLEERPFAGRFGSLQDDMEVRRGRLYVQGRLYDDVEYKFELDFAGGSVTAKDMYMGLRGLPIGVRFGHVKEPFSLEEQTSSRFITFMERSLLGVFSPARNTGVLLSDRFNGGRSTWAVGLFRDSDGFRATPGDNYNLSARLTHLLVRSEDDRRLVHVGLSAQRRWLDGIYKLGARPGDHLAPKLASLAVPADTAVTLLLEAAANVGALGLQGEYASAWVDTGIRTPRLHAFYVQASYFLTGETRPYSGGRFGRLRPRENFPHGRGAWQVAARYARLDLSDALTDGTGELWNVTIGANWYWNPHARVMLDYERAGLPRLRGEEFSSLHARFMFDF